MAKKKAKKAKRKKQAKNARPKVTPKPKSEPRRRATRIAHVQQVSDSTISVGFVMEAVEVPADQLDRLVISYAELSQSGGSLIGLPVRQVCDDLLNSADDADLLAAFEPVPGTDLSLAQMPDLRVKLTLLKQKSEDATMDEYYDLKRFGHEAESDEAV